MLEQVDWGLFSQVVQPWSIECETMYAYVILVRHEKKDPSRPLRWMVFIVGRCVLYARAKKERTLDRPFRPQESMDYDDS